MKKYLGVAVSRSGQVFSHPCDGAPEAHMAAVERGDYPYTHLYEGDSVIEIVAKMQDELAQEFVD